jgi:hypothetical protein
VNKTLITSSVFRIRVRISGWIKQRTQGLACFTNFPAERISACGAGRESH